MANVLFKQGLQATLDNLRKDKQGVDGTFYLTTDSHRLYIGTGAGEIKPVNEGVTTVDTINDLPAIPTNDANKALMAGQFYYVKNGNILCVFSGTNWVQINSNTDTKIESFDVAAVSDGDNSNSATVTTTITDSAQLGSGSSPWADSFKIAVTNGLILSVDASGKITIDAADLVNSLKHTLDGKTTTAGQFEITLYRNGTAVGTAALKAGTNVTINDNTISAKDTTLDNENSNGEALEEGFSINIADSSGNVASATINPAIQTKDKDGNATNVSFKFVNGVATIDAYSTAAVDQKLKAIDAMVYKGTVASASDLASKEATAEIGHTYKASAAFTVAGTQVKIGDVLIANGTESNGIISSVTWDIIPSGDEAIVTYRAVAVDGGIQILDNSDSVIGQITVVGKSNDAVVVTEAKDTNKNTITVSHKEYGATLTPTEADAKNMSTSADDHVKNTIVVKAVTNVTRDKFGHLSGFETTEYTIKDTTVAMVAGEATVTGTANTSTITTSAGVQVTAKAEDEAGTSTASSASFDIASTNASLTVGVKDNSKVVLDFVWGTF